MVADLGLGKALDVSSRLTMIAGTPSFVAPEQAQGEPLDPRADQYSLAALDLPDARRPRAVLPRLAGGGRRTRPAAAAVDRPTATVPRRGRGRRPRAAWPAIARSAGPTSRRTSRPSPRRSATAATGPDARAVAAAGPAPDPAGRATDAGGVPGPVAGAAPGPEADRARAPRRGWSGWPCSRRPGPAATSTSSAATSSRPSVDETGTLFATVPGDWAAAQAPKGWRPPNGGGEFPALSVGTSKEWTDVDSTSQGVFLGILPGTELPEQVPQHPECGRAQEPVDDTIDQNPSRTVCLHRLPGRGDRRAGRAARVQPTALGAGPQRRAGHGQQRPQRRGDPRLLTRHGSLVTLAPTVSSRSARPSRSTSRPTTLISNSAVVPPSRVNHRKVL